MKFNYIKSLIAVAAIALTLNTTSCVNDLDVDPINPQQRWNWIKAPFLIRFMQVLP